MSHTILFVIKSLELGGAESQVVTLIEGLHQRGWDCEIFLFENKGPLRDRLKRLGVPIHFAVDERMSSRRERILQVPRSWFLLWRVIRRLKPDILHAYLPLANFLGASAGRLAGIPKIITSRRALSTHQDRMPLWKPLDRCTNRLSDWITVNSQAVKNDVLIRDHPDVRKLIAIPNGLNLLQFKGQQESRRSLRQSLGLTETTPGVLTVGNLIPYKGHADLIQAVPSIIHQHPESQFFLVGEDRGIQGNLERLARRLEVGQRIHFEGRKQNVAAMLAAMDVFVLPSHEEGFSNALLEAMASGLGIVATEVGGNREALDDGHCGLLVPVKNPEALSEAVCRLLKDGSARRELGRRAAQRARSLYGVDRMIEAHLALYSG